MPIYSDLWFWRERLLEAGTPRLQELYRETCGAAEDYRKEVDNPQQREGGSSRVPLAHSKIY